MRAATRRTSACSRRRWRSSRRRSAPCAASSASSPSRAAPAGGARALGSRGVPARAGRALRRGRGGGASTPRTRRCSGVDLEFDVPDVPMPAALDREMLRRALGNIVRNAAQALRDAQRAAPGGGARGRPAAAVWGSVRVSARSEGQSSQLHRDRRRRPGHRSRRAGLGVRSGDVTTRYDGTGLGLSIEEEDRGRSRRHYRRARVPARRRALRHPAQRAGTPSSAAPRSGPRPSPTAIASLASEGAAPDAASRSRRAGAARGEAVPAGAESASEPNAGRRALPGSALRAAGGGLGAESAPPDRSVVRRCFDQPGPALPCSLAER